LISRAIVSPRLRAAEYNLSDRCTTGEAREDGAFRNCTTSADVIVSGFATWAKVSKSQALVVQRTPVNATDHLTSRTEKGSKKKGSQAGDEDSGSAATASTLSSVADLGFDDSSAIDDDPFEASIDALYEKRCEHTSVGRSFATPVH